MSNNEIRMREEEKEGCLECQSLEVFAPLFQGQPGKASQGTSLPSLHFLVWEGHGTRGARGPACWHRRPSSAHFPSCELCLWVQGQEEGHGPWSSASPLAASRGKAEIPEILSVPVRKRRVWLGDGKSHKAHPRVWWVAMGQKGIRVGLQTERSLQGGGCLPGQLLQAQVLHRSQVM